MRFNTTQKRWPSDFRWILRSVQSYEAIAWIRPVEEFREEAWRHSRSSLCEGVGFESPHLC